MNTTKKSTRVWIVQSISLLVAFFLVAFLFLYKGNRVAVSPPREATTTGQSQSRRVVPEGMREYQSATYHFSLFYPQELTVEERSEGGGASTITFQNVEKGEGFQIFIVPYSEAQVSEQRFKQDVPSGVRESLSNLSVDGATAAAFYSTNAALGATREVWFVRGGFLYEVTTLKPLDTWLGTIIQTWKFI
ncbi:MAG: hypothetical protein Q8L37_00090 [Candidatus Gottesmanbacteria bacterium]|nr:hypothetical protein [Candidatus Gottesmanbacteria bacterium]